MRLRADKGDLPMCQLEAQEGGSVSRAFSRVSLPSASAFVWAETAIEQSSSDDLQVHNRQRQWERDVPSYQ